MGVPGRASVHRAGALGLCVLLGLLANETGAEPPPENRLRFKRLTTDQGLSDSTVEAVLQDRRGFMWFGTADGLNRYDGYDFKVYTPDELDPDSISGGYIWDLYEDREGVLWVATSTGLSRYIRETDTFVSYVHDPTDDASLSQNNVQHVVEDGRGQLWVATSGGLNRLDRLDGTFARYMPDAGDPQSLSHGDVQVLHEDSGGRLWVGTQGGLDLFDEELDGFLHYRHDADDESSLSHDFVRAITEDGAGRLWVGTEDGLNRLDPGRRDRFTRYQSDPSDPASIQARRVWTVLEDSRGVLWAGTDRGGLAYFDPDREAFVHYVHDPSDVLSISSNVVRTLYEDATGDLWTGNYAGGVNLADRSSVALSTYSHVREDPRSLNHDSVLAFFEDSSGEVWVGTEDGLARFDRAEGRFLRYLHAPGDPETLSAPAVLSIHEDRRGQLWVGTYGGGLNRLDRETGTFVRHRLEQERDPSGERSQIWSIADDRQGYLWVGTFGGLFRVDPAGDGSVLYRHDPADPTSLGHDIVWDLHEDRAGRLWAGTHAGLGLYDREQDSFVNYRHRVGDPGSLSFDQVTAIYDDPEARLWVGTHGGGLNLFDRRRQSFTTFRLADGLPSDVVLSVVADLGGDLWLGTNKGLSRYIPRTGTFANFDHNDGLQGRQFNRRAALRSRTGELFFGGINGFNVFFPDSIQVNSVAPPVVITGFRIFNQPVEIGDGAPLQKQISEADTISLRHGQSVLSFEFAALDFRNPDRNEYAFMLEGFDADWVRAGTQRSVTYTNLAPGTYTFRAKGSNNNGVWNEQGTAIRLIVPPPIWAHWWFRLASLAALGGLVFAAYRLRVRTFRNHNLALEAEIGERRGVERERERLMAEMEIKGIELERQNSELERFAYTVSHDLKSPLVTIRGFLGLLEKDAEAGDWEGMRGDIRQIDAASKTMARLLGEVLELSRIGRVANPAEEIGLTQLAKEAAELLGGQLKERAVELEIAPDMPTVLGDRIRLLEVFQNLIANGAKFMDDQRQPRVSVGAHVEDDRVVCFVQDNGRGVDPRYHDKIFGLFERLHPDAEGSGIGLALVKRIVEVHGGRVWVESEGAGHGATFWFSLAHSPRTEGLHQPLP